MIQHFLFHFGDWTKCKLWRFFTINNDATATQPAVTQSYRKVRNDTIIIYLVHKCTKLIGGCFLNFSSD